jgi:GH25 family lysozyme M1 (1,4-beta-N-acetylmuramidase)
MTVIGLDYASVDGNATPDFAAAKKAGAQFAIPRAVYGRSADGKSKTPFIDPVWPRDKDKIKAAGLIRSAYLFVCYERKGVQTASPEDQAQAFIDHVQLEAGKDLVPMFDVEEESNVLSADEMYDWTRRVCVKLKAHYGAWPGMYTSARVWTENLKNHAAGDLLECPLWLAKPWPWAVKTPIHLDGAPSAAPATIPQWGDQWFLYQYQGDATKWPGFGSTVDADRFHLLSKGAKGDSVKWVQRRLGVDADGDFGAKTETAVKALQAKHGLTQDGVIGPATFAPLCWLNP